jgi:hypothetical protein
LINNKLNQVKFFSRILTQLSMIPQQITARKKKYIGNACWLASVPTEGGADRNADAAPLKIPLTHL